MTSICSSGSSANKSAAAPGATNKIRENPDYLMEAIASNKLNLSAVEEEFYLQIESICGPIVPSDVKTALAALNSSVMNDVAEVWLSGARLTPDQASLLRVREPQAGDTELLGLLVSLAALLNADGRGLVIMIDELEHLADYDRAHTERKNLTWLKRLLEGLATPNALVFVAGHSVDAWELEPNLLTRFADHIRLLVLSPAEITRYIEFVIGRKLKNFEKQSNAIHEATGGRMRDVLTLCSSLFDESQGFTQVIDPATIRAKTAVLEAHAIDGVQGVLQELGYSVRRSSIVLGGAQFDLLAYRSGALEIVFDFQHVVTQENPKMQIKPFLERVREVAAVYPNLLVCRVAEGNADPELTALVRQSGLRALYFDTKSRDFLVQIREALRTNVLVEPTVPAPKAIAIMEKKEIIDRQFTAAREEGNQAVLDELRKQRLDLDRQLDELRKAVKVRDATFEKELDELDQRRKKDYEQLRKRAEQASVEAPESREATLAGATVPQNKLETTYADISNEYRPTRAFRIVAGRLDFMLYIGLIATGITTFFIASDMFNEKMRYAFGNSQFAYIEMRIMAVALFFAGFLLLLRSVISALRYYEHARRLLREIYLKSQEPTSLTAADATLQELLTKYGPRQAMLLAREEISKQLPSGPEKSK